MGGGVELDPVSFRVAGLDPTALASGVRASLAEGVWNSPRSVGSAGGKPTVPDVFEGDRQGLRSSEKPGPSGSAQSGALGIRLRGPDDMELLIEPYDDGYVWRIRNGQLQAIERIRFEILGVQSFDADKAAFREATTTFRAYWTPIYKLLSGELTKGVIFVAFEGDGLRLGQTAGMNSLSWPSGDPSTARRWLLNMRVAGLSQEWPIGLDLRWTVGTKALALSDCRENRIGHPVPHASGSASETLPGMHIESQEPEPLTPSGEAASAKKRAKPRNQAARDSAGKGDTKLLTKADGTFYSSVDFPTVESYADISPRRRQQLMSDGVLTVVGKGRNRRIEVQSLIAYCPPKDTAK